MKKNIVKIKDLPPSTNLGGIKVKTTSGTVGYWKSQWNKGVWLTSVPPDTPGPQSATPVFVDDLKEVLEWQVLSMPETMTPPRESKEPDTQTLIKIGKLKTGDTFAMDGYHYTITRGGHGHPDVEFKLQDGKDILTTTNKNISVKLISTKK